MNTILDLLAEEMSSAAESSAHPPSAVDSDVTDDETEQTAITRRSDSPLRFTDQHALLKLRLAPLRELQKDLEEYIGASSGEEDVYQASSVDTKATSAGARRRTRGQEAFIRVNNAWKLNVKSFDNSHQNTSRRSRESKAREAAEIIAGCAEDMRAVWEDATVQKMLRKRHIMMEAMSGL